MLLEKIVSFDIDGVLNNYPDCWLKYLNHRTQSEFENISRAKEILDENIYNLIKDEYRLMGENSIFTITNAKMIKLINKFYEDNYYVIISTSRPLMSSKYPNLYNLTYQWLKKEGVCFSELIYKDDTLSNHTHLLDRILFHLDDEIKYVDLFKKYKVNSFRYTYTENYDYSELFEILSQFKR